MIGSLITSQTRIKLLKKFFLNSHTKAHLRGLEAEFGESTNSIRVELNRLEAAGLLISSRSGNRKFYQANSGHPLFKDIHSIILKETGIDKVIDKVIHRVGDLESVYLTGDFAQGRDSSIIELVLVGNNIDTGYLTRKIDQVKNMVGRRISYVLLDNIEVGRKMVKYNRSDLLLLWKADVTQTDDK